MATPTSLPAAFTSSTLASTTMNNLRGAFRMLQNVTTAYATQTGTSSGTYASTGHTATITPQATSNTINISFSIPCSTDAAGCTLGIRLLRTIGASSTTVQTWTYAHANFGSFSYQQTTFLVTDTPATTSACVYTIQIARTSGSGTAYTYTGNTNGYMFVQEMSA